MIEDRVQLENSRRKLRVLEELYEKTRQREASYARDASLRTLKQRINSFIEEIAVFEAHHPTAS